MTTTKPEVLAPYMAPVIIAAIRRDYAIRGADSRRIPSKQMLLWPREKFVAWLNSRKIVLTAEILEEVAENVAAADAELVARIAAARAARKLELKVITAFAATISVGDVIGDAVVVQKLPRGAIVVHVTRVSLDKNGPNAAIVCHISSSDVRFWWDLDMVRQKEMAESAATNDSLYWLHCNPLSNHLPHLAAEPLQQSQHDVVFATWVTNAWGITAEVILGRINKTTKRDPDLFGDFIRGLKRPSLATLPDNVRHAGRPTAAPQPPQQTVPDKIAEYCAALGLEPNAKRSRKDIRRAYLRMAHKWHPDKNRHNLAEANKKFCAIKAGYDYLMDVVVL